MRRLCPLLVLLSSVPGCRGDDLPDPVLVPNFVARSESAVCTRMEPPGGAPRSVERLATVSESTLVVLHAAERELGYYGADGEVLARASYETAGPVGIADPRDVTVVDDAFYVADRPSRHVKVIGLDGSDRGVREVSFLPEGILAVPGGLVMSLLPLPGDDARLIHLLPDEGPPAALGIPPARVGEWRLDVLANQLVLGGFPDGRVVVVHRYLVPRAHVLPSAAGGTVRTVSVPIPDGVRTSVGWIPDPPFTEDEMRRILVPVIAGSPDPRTGDFLYLTRTGRTLDGRSEKAVVRVDERFRYLRSHLLTVNAGHLAYLAPDAVSVVVDELDRWYRCATP